MIAACRTDLNFHRWEREGASTEADGNNWKSCKTKKYCADNVWAHIQSQTDTNVK